MKKILKLLCLVIFMFVIGNNYVDAAGNYTISLTSSSVTKGKSVSLYIKGNYIAGGFSISSSDSTVASVSTSSVWVDNDTQIVTINTSKVGSTTIKVSPTSVSDYDGNDLNLPSKTLTLTVKSSSSSNTSGGSDTNVKLNDDATLKSLSIEGIDISPSFKSDVLQYTATAKAGVEKVNVSAEVNNSKTSVSGTGEVKVSEGANKIEVVVTAEDKTTKTYVITLIVEEYEPIKVKVGEYEYNVVRKDSDLPEVDLFEKSKVKIGEEEVSGYYNDKLNIYLIGLKDENGNVSLYVYDTKKQSYVKYEWITVGGVTLYLIDAEDKLDNFNKYSVTIKNVSVDIYKVDKDKKIGLVYGVNVLTGNKGYYIYDKEEATLTRYYDDEVEIYKDKVEEYKNYMMIVVGAVSAVIIIIVLISLIRSRKSKRKVNR